MEEIKFSFKFNGEDLVSDKKIVVKCNSKGGLSVPEICDAFIELMESAGYSLGCVYDYFNNK